MNDDIIMGIVAGVDSSMMYLEHLKAAQNEHSDESNEDKIEQLERALEDARGLAEDIVP